ncbi:Uncharacterized protein HZ326_29957 [Fusarium oxysporum f. sp. albedinis]|nr:Uncharacterized protein HZ326_29957 [Fusarium oxysporum f. sp. albedinis]
MIDSWDGRNGDSDAEKGSRPIPMRKSLYSLYATPHPPSCCRGHGSAERLYLGGFPTLEIASLLDLVQF